MTALQPSEGAGRVFLLNGVPRAGKSSIARALQDQLGTPTVNLGVDLARAATPPDLQPGVGLRPGGERPDLEPFIAAHYGALFDSIAANAKQGINVAADFGIHDAYSRPLGIWEDAAERLADIPVHVVGVRCSLDVVLARRAAEADRYESAIDGEVPAAVIRWEQAVHEPGWYDVEVDTSVLSPEECARHLLGLANDRPPTALQRHRGGGLA